MTEEAWETVVILFGLILAIGFRWGMGRLADAIDDFRKSWERLHELRDDNEEEKEEEG